MNINTISAACAIAEAQRTASLSAHIQQLASRSHPVVEQAMATAARVAASMPTPYAAAMASVERVLMANTSSPLSITDAVLRRF